MNGNQFESFTPCIHPSKPTKTSRTWQPRKIRLHNSSLSTPSIVRNDPQSLQCKTTRVRVTARSHDISHPLPSVLKTTPVTHPTTSKPLRFRIAGAQSELASTCRRLFPNSTPTKRPYESAPSFRFSCGRERTQPCTNQGRGHLVNALDAQTDQAERNLSVFQELLADGATRVAFQDATRGGLCFEVVGRQDNILVLRSPAHRSDQETSLVAVVVTDKMISETIKEISQLDSSMQIVYIPHPWHAQVVDEFIVCASRIRVLLAVHKMDVFHKEKLSSLGDFPMNADTDSLLSGEPIITDSVTENQHSAHETHFAALSPHTRTVNLSVFLDFCQGDCDIAIVSDEATEIGILMAQNVDLELTSEKIIVSNVSILPFRVSSKFVLEIIGDRCDEDLYNRLTDAENAKTFIAFKRIDNQTEMEF